MKLSLDEQLALFDLPNAAEVFLEYASLSDAFYKLYMRLSKLPKRPHGSNEAQKEVEKIFDRIFSPQDEQEASLNLTYEETREIYKRGGYLWPEVQMKFFEVFPKDVVKKIFIDYSNGPLCNVCEEAQMKIFDFFSKDEAKDLLLNSGIKLSINTHMFVYENFSKDDALSILAHNAIVGGNIVEKILERPDAKEYLMEFFNKGGRFTLSLWDSVAKDVTGPQMLIIEHFSEEDATEILLKIMTGKEEGDCLSEPVMNKIIDKFSKANAKKLLMTHIVEREGNISEETQARIIDVFSKEDAKELLIAYMKNDNEFETEIEKKIISSFSLEDAKEILMACIKNCCTFEDESLILILKSFSKADAKELIMTYITGEDDLSDEFILNVLETFSPADAKEFLLTYGDNKGRYGEEVEKKVLSLFEKEEAKELLLKNMNNHSYFSDEIFMLILYSLSVADAKELIMTYLESGEKDFSYELTINIMETLPMEDAKEILRKYKKNGGILCKEAQRFLGRK